MDRTSGWAPDTARLDQLAIHTIRFVTPVHGYKPGTWGPAEANRLTAAVGGWAQPEVES